MTDLTSRIADDAERFIKLLEATYTAWNNPPSPELPEGASCLPGAAALIRRMAARIEELEKALEPIAAMQPILAQPLVAGATDLPDETYVGGGITYGMLRTAARALKGERANQSSRPTRRYRPGQC
jgi:hypothetical protein